MKNIFYLLIALLCLLSSCHIPYTIYVRNKSKKNVVLKFKLKNELNLEPDFHFNQLDTIYSLKKINRLVRPNPYSKSVMDIEGIDKFDSVTYNINVMPEITMFYFSKKYRPNVEYIVLSSSIGVDSIYLDYNYKDEVVNEVKDKNHRLSVTFKSRYNWVFDIE
ncbi:hypothetical protein R9C00_18815 [Flammeovirgaceae bacterium SG7u.111]|nr:hypothetical protein [Flammeovirgaceae bacterium SG7u.132]WPO33753.1 hypothetical protein R9C00_18815 [Flammeovirgaceae bacterium SG7u.111]